MKECTLFSIILEYAFILTLYCRNVNKFCYVIALMIGVGAMLVIPSAPGHMAKASTCSFSFGFHGPTVGSTSTTSGGCSGGGSLAVGAGGSSITHGGSRSSCTAGSSGGGGNAVQFSDSNGAVSCSSHSP